MPDYYALAQQIDAAPEEVSSWEAEFLETILRQGPGAALSPKQHQKLRELGERYLPYHVMAEFQGQQPLL